MMFSLEAQAKINLTLDVLGKRPDGYHEVEMIMQSIQLHDVLHFSLREQGLELISAVEGVADDKDNLIYQTAVKLKELYNVTAGAKIILEKNIPVAAGLAGGSADAAATLQGLNKLWSLNLSLDTLCEIGAQLGSDIPFCLRGGTMLAKGRGEILTPLPSFPQTYVVLAKPVLGVSTAWVYNNYDQSKVDKHPETAMVIEELQKKNSQGIAALLCNVLESVTIKKYNEISLLKEKMLEFGASASLMSGSGPTVFGLVDTKEQAEELATRLEQLTSARIIVTRTV